MSPYPSESKHPVRRWVVTGIFSVIVFFCCYGLVSVLDRIANKASVAEEIAERQAIKDLAESIKQQNLCGVIAYLVQRSNASLPTIEYYKEHPDELEAAQRTNRETLEILACDPISPPPPVELLPQEIRIHRGPH